MTARKKQGGLMTLAAAIGTTIGASGAWIGHGYASPPQGNRQVGVERIKSDEERIEKLERSMERAMQKLEDYQQHTYERLGEMKTEQARQSERLESVLRMLEKKQ
jgi:hypothetical protein